MQQIRKVPASSFGKTSRVHSAQIKEKISESSLKRSRGSKTAIILFLDLRKAEAYDGAKRAASWETNFPLLGEPSTLNFGESPKDAEESTLSQILEVNVLPKYYLSATACRGVLRRAVNRGKELPTLLKIALCLQGKLTADEIHEMGIFKNSELMFYDGAKVYDARGNGDGEVFPTLTGDHGDRVTDYTALVCYIDYAAFNQGMNAKYDFGVDKKTAFTLTGKGPGAVCFAIGNGQADQLGLHEKAGALNCMHDEQAVLCYCLQGNCIDRADSAGCNGAGYKEGTSYTLNTIDRHAVVFIGIDGDKAGTLDANYFKGCGAREDTERDIIACAVAERQVIYVYIRRLTPTECARLQGMPAWWCADVPHANAPEYKMWGNGMALPNILFVIEGIAEILKNKEIRK